MDNVFRMIHVLAKHGNEFLDKKLKEYGISCYHYTFIKKIYENPGITRDYLKNIVHVHPSNTTRALDYLEEKELIIKKKDKKDRRICELYPTKALEDIYFKIIECEEEWINIITKVFTEEEKKKYFSLIEKSYKLSIKEIHK